jgi:hypothetical protein
MYKCKRFLPVENVHRLSTLPHCSGFRIYTFRIFENMAPKLTPQQLLAEIDAKLQQIQSEPDAVLRLTYEGQLHRYTETSFVRDNILTSTG